MGSDASAGPGLTLDQLTVELWQSFRALARRQLLRERADHTLRPTELAHEAYLRLKKSALASFDSRDDFLRVAAQVIRHVLVDHARRRGRLKRAGTTVELSETIGERDPSDGAEALVHLDRLLERLHTEAPDAARVAQLHVFGGLTLLEIADREGFSERTARRRWRLARAWLTHHLFGPAEVPEKPHK